MAMSNTHTTLSRPLAIKVHVGHAFASQSKQFDFRNAMWEYIANSIQYVDPGVKPIITIQAYKDKITIRDNGRGMDTGAGREGLQHFLTMYGRNDENGRGKFGTGKTGGLNIAQTIIVDTTRNGLRNRIHISANQIDKSGDGEAIPVKHDIINQPTDEPNGTTVTLDGLARQYRNQQAHLITAIKRILRLHWVEVDQVEIRLGKENGAQEIKVEKPKAVSTYLFKPSAQQAAVIGDCTLTIGVSEAPLGDARGVVILSKPGAMVAHHKPNGEGNQFIFGFITVPALENDDVVAAYTSNRGLTLNTENPAGRVTTEFVEEKMEEVRSELEKERRAQERSNKNELYRPVFNHMIGTINNVLSRINKEQGIAPDNVKAIPTDTDGNAALPSGGKGTQGNRRPGGGGGSQDGGSGGEGRPGDVTDKGGTRAKALRLLGIQMRGLGGSSDWAVFDRTARQIIINTDHPMIKAAEKVSADIKSEAPFMMALVNAIVGCYAGELARLSDIDAANPDIPNWTMRVELDQLNDMANTIRTELAGLIEGHLAINP